VKVVLTRQAREEIVAIGDYIARDSPERARVFVRELRARIMRLGRRPQLFPLVPRYAEAGIRRVPHGNYLIFYRIDEHYVVVIHIIHGARDYGAILFPELPG
jgi:plasmid stabilization system protein ParE